MTGTPPTALDLESGFRFRAELQVTLPGADRLLDGLAEHAADEVPQPVAPGTVLRFPYYGGLARLAYEGDRLLAVASADDLGALATLRHFVAHAVRSFDGSAAIGWTGDGCDRRDLPQLREMRVVGVSDVTPRMRRVRLAGADLERFATGGLHVRLLFPPKGRPPVWPQADGTGIPLWPSGADRLTARTYTIRRFAIEAGTVDIDIALHEGSSPGSDFAREARPGDLVGMIGPGGGGAVSAERLLLAGDETALPAIARMLEVLSADQRGLALIEVHDDAEIQPLVHPRGLDVVWLSRGGRPAGTTSLLVDTVTRLDWPAKPGCFVWAAAEFSAFKRLRTHCRKVWSLNRTNHMVAAYWRRGTSEDTAD
ncbi:siderophore-interacting protein [Aurantimonas sp. VKM B-3413]|uniref:siderophore-interacting protein n=1 Tax=Aurantimonas sp. VKM B-3413 TaxID=2779401 RepID=UPI001E4F9EC7|nr:siderophore-interacting protein [Aurantimonas sp. VKM B-3413]MCB8835864.1 siderophore-interacting protein [Aurantimonas sp. VKM B-3413]